MKYEVKLDKKDRRILYELDCDARQSHAQLARKVGLRQETVRYRVRRLEQRGILQQGLTVVNTSKLGYAFYKILLRLHNVDQRKRKEIIEYLIADQQTAWVVDIDGSYDIGIVAAIVNIVELDVYLAALYQRFYPYISKHDISTNIIGEYCPRDYLIGKKREFSSKTSYTANFEPSADETDKRIIRMLTNDTRRPAVEMASVLGVAVDTVLQRIKRLERDGVVSRYTVVLNHEAIGQLHYKVLLYFSDFSPQLIERFVNYCRSIDRVVYIIKALGHWRYELDIEVESVDQFRTIMMALTTEFSTLLRDYDALIIRRVYKYNTCP